MILASGREVAMDHDIPTSAQNLSMPYEPLALYFAASDTVEYVREDIPCVHIRVDSYLTLIVDMFDRAKLVGFALKGFKNTWLKPSPLGDDRAFLSVVGVLERAITRLVDAASDQRSLQADYRRAHDLALRD